MVGAVQEDKIQIGKVSRITIIKQLMEAVWIVYWIV